MTTDVVCLVGENCWDVGISCNGGEEDAEVTEAIVGGVAEEGKTDETKDGVKGDDWAADVPFVGKPGLGEHDYGGHDVWWSDETLGGSKGEAHSFT